MLGKKKTLSDKIKELKIYSKRLGAVNAPDVFKIYIVKVYKKKSIDVLVMHGNKFLGYRSIKASTTFKVFDLKEDEVYMVYRYKDDKSYQLSLVDESCIKVAYANVSRVFHRCGSRNEEVSNCRKVYRVEPLKVGVKYTAIHEILVLNIKKHNYISIKD